MGPQEAGRPLGKVHMMQTRNTLDNGDVARKLRYSTWLRPNAKRVGYVGWIGRGNLGDEVMHQVHQRILCGTSVVDLPDVRALKAIARFCSSSLPSAAVLGGGTLVGYPRIRTSFEILLRKRPNLVVSMLGSGVELPDPTTGSASMLDRELERWKPLLRIFPEVNVRGPLSQKRLADFDIDASVVGDPALLAASGYYPGTTSQQGLIGLNIGIHDSMTSSVRLALHATCVATCRRLVSQGYQILLLPVCGPDVEFCKQMAAEVGSGIELETNFLATDIFLSRAAECDLMIAQKLHAAVLAASVGVPSIALEYQPKCRDFQASIGREQYCYRLHDLVPDALVEAVTTSLAARDTERSELDRRTTELRQQLHHAAIRERTHLKGRDNYA
jgi:hypothetical protein